MVRTQGAQRGAGVLQLDQISVIWQLVSSRTLACKTRDSEGSAHCHVEQLEPGRGFSSIHGHRCVKSAYVVAYSSEIYSYLVIGISLGIHRIFRG